jgi:hypothetical protein
MAKRDFRRPIDVTRRFKPECAWVHGSTAMQAYSTAYYPGDDGDTVLANLLCDLMHYGSRRDVSFDAALATARQNFAFDTVKGSPTTAD